mgnify:CR=1 FL=1
MKSIPKMLAVVLALGFIPQAGAEEMILSAALSAPVKPFIQEKTPVISKSTVSRHPESTAFLMQTSSLQASQPIVSDDGYFLGVKKGAVLNDEIFIQINPEKGLRVKKVAYYLDGSQAGREYTSPFTFGGADGYDTKTLPDGNHTLSGSITTYTGELKFSYTFKVDNSGNVETEPDPLPSGDPLPNRTSVELLERAGTWEYNPAEVTELAAADGVNVTMAEFDTLAARARQQTGTAAGSTFNALYEPYYMAYESGSYTAIVISTSDRVKYRYGCTNGCAEEVSSGGAYSVILFKSPKHPQGIILEVNHYLKSSTGFGFSPDGELLLLGTAASNKILIYDQDGKQTATADSTKPAGETTPPSSSDTVGITNGATVSGSVFFGPNLTKNPGVRKVSYYLNGAQSGKYYERPYYWGGNAGFDTRNLANGTYTLSGIYTTASGDTRFAPVTFTVKN